MPNVRIKFKKDQFPLQLQAKDTLQTFKLKIQAITTIPTARQKLIHKGSVLKNDQNLKKIMEGSSILVMGSPEGQGVIMPPKQSIKFIQDLSPQQKIKLIKEKTGIGAQIGLQNFGNTCYMNSTIQCMKRVNQLKENLSTGVIKKDQPNGIVANTLGQLFKYMQTGTQTSPITNIFVSVFRNFNPQFNQKDQTGYPMQQDADQFLIRLLQHLQPICSTLGLDGQRQNLINKLFQINYQCTFKNMQIQEQNKIMDQKAYKQICIIDNQGNPINTLQDGIKASVDTHIQMFSNISQKNCLFLKQQRIKKLPSYMLVQMIRFFWKQADQASGTKATKSKILRNVAFPRILDASPYCTDKLKEQLQVGKQYQKKQRQEQDIRNKEGFDKYKKDLEEKGKLVAESTSQLYKKYKQTRKQQQVKKHDEMLYRAHGLGLQTGSYELVGVITHQGRSANSGHYVGWAHQTGDVWSKYDDDVVSTVKTDNILELRGGGDWHMAYYLVYRKLQVL